MSYRVEVVTGGNPLVAAATWWAVQIGADLALALDEATIWSVARTGDNLIACVGARQRTGGQFQWLSPAVSDAVGDSIGGDLIDEMFGDVLGRLFPELDAAILTSSPQVSARLLLPTDRTVVAAVQPVLARLGYAHGADVAFYASPTSLAPLTSTPDVHLQRLDEPAARGCPMAGNPESMATASASNWQALPSAFRALFAETLAESRAVPGLDEQIPEHLLTDFATDCGGDFAHWYYIRVGGQQIGCVLMDGRDRQAGHISLLYLGLLPAWRGRGCGSGALGCLGGVRELRDAIFLASVDLGNDSARRMYERSGWRMQICRELWWKRWNIGRVTA